MGNAIEVVKHLMETDEEFANLMKTYEELEKVYLESLSAITPTTKVEANAQNTSQVTLSFDTPPSSAKWSEV